MRHRTDAELEVETIERVVDRVVVQERDLGSVALLGRVNVDELRHT